MARPWNNQYWSFANTKPVIIIIYWTEYYWLPKNYFYLQYNIISFNLIWKEAIQTVISIQRKNSNIRLNTDLEQSYGFFDLLIYKSILENIKKTDNVLEKQKSTSLWEVYLIRLFILRHAITCASLHR